MKKENIEATKEYLYSLYKAKNTLWYFINCLEKKNDNYSSIKFKNNEGTYVWLENLKYENGFFHGTLTENQESEKISEENIIDWMIVDDNRLIGGYTIRYFRNGLTKEERINFDIDFGLKIDDGNDFFYPDSSTAEGIIIALEEAYTKKSINDILACKDFKMEAENLLKETHHPITDQLIIETGELLKISLIENLQHYGFPSFNNVERSFTLLNEKFEGRQKLIFEKLIFDNGDTKSNKLWVGQDKNSDWKVLNLVD